uniref:Uncharacterized protein n=1 Tax=Panagrolaimus sp. JU765 TaxID=591449 RepID=A0AC34R715_9BILA
WIDAKVGELTMDSKPKAHSPGSHKSTPTKPSKMDDFCFDDPDHDTSEEETIDPDADAMLAMGLPVCFDQTSSSNKKSGASKKKLFNVDNYWTRFGKLFTSGVEELSKLTEGDAIENTLFYTALKAAVSRATKLVKNHTKVEYFYDLLKAGKLEPTEEDVMRLIKSDVAKFNTICTSNDAVNFVKKLRQLHYVSGFQLKKNDNDKVCKPESAVEILKDYESVKFRTFPPLIPKKIVNYNLMDCEDLDAPEVEESKSGIVK